MYLTNIELTKIAETVIKECSNPRYPFDQNEQIKVCSIDIRVNNIFWRSRKKHSSIDLGSRNIYEISPRRLWKRQVIEENGTIKLKPGEMLLGSTYEKIFIPEGFVGKINARSSYARLGISTACNCDLINPGYEGHVPLEIINHTKNTFLIHPYLPLCQIFLMKTDGEFDDSSYSSNRFNSKYINDDGGPSVWWRDNLVKNIAKVNLKTQISDNALDKLREIFESIDDDGLYRLDQRIKSRGFENSTQLINDFAISERKKWNYYRIRRGVSKWLTPALTIPSFLQYQQRVGNELLCPDFITYSIWGLTLIGVPFFIYYWIRKEVKYYHDIEQ